MPVRFSSRNHFSQIERTQRTRQVDAIVIRILIVIAVHRSNVSWNDNFESLQLQPNQLIWFALFQNLFDLQ